MIQTRCSAINLNPMNQALTFIPNPQVSFNISIVQSPHHIIIARNMKFHALPKCGVFLVSIIAMAIKSNSSDSSAKEAGNGSEKFLFMMNQLTTMRAPKTAIFHLNATYTNNIANGDKQMTAKAL